MTASAAAREAGIEGSEKYLDVSSIATDEQLAGMCEDYTVFGRVTPERKRVIIKALKKAGHTVAMTGDGVNDVLAQHCNGLRQRGHSSGLRACAARLRFCRYACGRD